VADAGQPAKVLPFRPRHEGPLSVPELWRRMMNADDSEVLELLDRLVKYRIAEGPKPWRGEDG
jgi:hypothetical protein